MSAPGPVQIFVLRPPLPIRALAVTAVLALLGAVLLVVWSAASLPAVVLVLALLLLAAAAALGVAAAVAVARRQQRLTLDVGGVTLVNRLGRRTLPWGGIRELRLDGARLLVLPVDDDPVEVILPPVGPRRSHARLIAALQAGLDRDRGYRTLS